MSTTATSGGVQLVRQQSPEDRELNCKRAALAALQAELASRELDLATLRAALHAFEKKYVRVVGKRYAELDEVLAQIAEAEARLNPRDTNASKRAADVRQQARESAGAATVDGMAPPPSFQPSEALKKLYRQSAKAMHPDLADSDEERARRHEFMARVNRAYEMGDEEGLRAILHEWESSPESVNGDGIGAELVRLIRKIACVEDRIQAIGTEITTLKDSDLSKLMARTEEAEQQGRNLLAEMASKVAGEIGEAHQRLAQFSGNEKGADIPEAKHGAVNMGAEPEKRQCIRVLVVENDADQRALIRETLADHFGRDTVAIAERGREALAWDLTAFDIILVDLDVPDINGIDLLRAILAKCDRPVIAVTDVNVRHIAAQAIRAGAYDFIVKAGEYLFTLPLTVEKNLEGWRVKQESKRLHEHQQLAVREISAKNQRLNDALQKLQQLAATESLTGLYNRRHFGEALERHFAEALEQNQDLACMMCDLNGFHRLNETLSHEFGDKVLQVTAKVITRNLRVMDVAARYRGDEFIVLFPQTSAALAATLCERIHAQFTMQMKSIVPLELPLTISIGIASLQHNRPANAASLSALAEKALRGARRRGKNKMVVSDSESK